MREREGESARACSPCSDNIAAGTGECLFTRMFIHCVCVCVHARARVYEYTASMYTCMYVYHVYVVDVILTLYSSVVEQR